MPYTAAMRRWRWLIAGPFLLLLIVTGLSIWWSAFYMRVSPTGTSWALGVEQGRLGVFAWSQPAATPPPPSGAYLNRFPPDFKWLPESGFRPMGLSLAIPLWPLVMGLGAASVIACRRAPRSPTACPACGYEMQGASGSRCPECGAEQPA
jgi:hypothetical protein